MKRKKIGESATWRTVNGTASGIVKKIRVTYEYVMQLPTGKVVVITDQEIIEKETE